MVAVRIKGENANTWYSDGRNSQLYINDSDRSSQCPGASPSLCESLGPLGPQSVHCLGLYFKVFNLVISLVYQKRENGPISPLIPITQLQVVITWQSITSSLPILFHLWIHHNPSP